MTAKQVCTNCGNSFRGPFCNECGQKITHRISMAHIGHDMLHAFTHADKGIFHLLLQLFIKPGVVAREYIIEGKRKKYFLPFQYILIIGTIAAFVAVNTNFIEQTTQALGSNVQYSARQLAFMQKVNMYQSKYYNFMILAQLPFYALGTFLVFRRHQLNYAEHLTLQTFVTAQTALIAMLIMLLVLIIGKSGVYTFSTMAMLTFCFQVFAYTQFFREFSFKGVSKAILVNFIGLMFFVIFVSVVMLIYGLSTNAFNS